MVKTVLKPFRPSGSPIILVFFWPLRRYPIPIQRWCKIHWGHRLSRKWCEIGRWLIWNVNRKSWVPDRMVLFALTLYQKRCVLGTKLLKNTNRKPHTMYRIIPLSMTLSDLWPRFQGPDIFRHWMSQKQHEREPQLL